MWYALLTIFFGLIGLYIGRRGYAAVHEAINWPTVPGLILERGLGPAMGDLNYQPYARYSYTVEGVQYENDQVYLIRTTGGLADRMRRLVDDLPDTVEVHFDPADPSRSYLVKQPMLTLHLATVLGGVATTVGVLMLLISIL
jgi:hypothetical protein